MIYYKIQQRTELYVSLGSDSLQTLGSDTSLEEQTVSLDAFVDQISIYFRNCTNNFKLKTQFCTYKKFKLITTASFNKTCNWISNYSTKFITYNLLM